MNRLKFRRRRETLAALGILVLAACGGGGDGGGAGNGTPPANRAPVANAGIDQNVLELTPVSLVGSGVDADNDTLTFAWTQTAGAAVMLTSADTATPGFTAPDVAAGMPETLTFLLTVDDGTVSASDSVNITVEEPAPQVTVTGKVNYEFVPPNNTCAGLDFTDIVVRPIRGAPVQLIDAGAGAVLASTTSDDAGDYTFANVDANTAVRLRVRAELKKTSGASTWDVEVRDNYEPAGATPLAQRPLYVVEGADFNTGTSSVHVQNMTATTGWGGASYTGDRAAAPFAILDAIYTAIRFVEAADPDADFVPLDAFWSENNTSVSGQVDLGEIGTSYFRGDIDSLFLLGDAEGGPTWSADTEEFDDHVIVHEWGHYFEDNFSRSDSIGGAHSIGQVLDPRLAFGEGWATAFAAMALNQQQYCDTGAPGTTAGFGIGAESGAYDGQGWYDEISVVRALYDLFDADDEGGDPGSLGFAPIYAVMTGPQASTDAFTSIFSFVAELRSTLAPADQAFVDSQLVREDMTPGFDIWGMGEANDAGGAPDVFPLYTDVTADGSTQSICVNSQFDPGRDGNKLSEARFLRITVPVTDAYDVAVTTTTALPADDPNDDRDQSDPDIYVYHGPQLVAAGSTGNANAESFTTPQLQSGVTYIADLEEWRFDDAGSPAAYPDRICFDVSFTPTP